MSEGQRSRLTRLPWGEWVDPMDVTGVHMVHDGDGWIVQVDRADERCIRSSKHETETVLESLCDEVGQLIADAQAAHEKWESAMRPPPAAIITFDMTPKDAAMLLELLPSEEDPDAKP